MGALCELLNLLFGKIQWLDKAYLPCFEDRPASNSQKNNPSDSVHTGSLWRDLPAEYGHWKNVHRRFCRWRGKEILEKILAVLIELADFKWLLSLFSFEILVQKQRQLCFNCARLFAILVKTPLTRACFVFFSKKLRSCLVVRGHSRGSIRKYTWHLLLIVFRSDFFVTDATVTDCSISEVLIAKFNAEYLLADRGYCTYSIIKFGLQAGMTLENPPKKKRKVLRNYEKYIYKPRHLIENIFLHLKRWRDVATRYAKNAASFVAAMQIRCVEALLTTRSRSCR